MQSLYWVWKIRKVDCFMLKSQRCGKVPIGQCGTLDGWISTRDRGCVKKGFYQPTNLQWQVWVISKNTFAWANLYIYSWGWAVHGLQLFKVGSLYGNHMQNTCSVLKEFQSFEKALLDTGEVVLGAGRGGWILDGQHFKWVWQYMEKKGGVCIGIWNIG